MARLVITDRQHHAQIFETAASVVTIGRVPSNDVVLDHPSVSRYHARVTVLAQQGPLLTDLQSLNGTFVNGRRIDTYQLAHSDRIEIGIYELSYQDPAEPKLEVEAGSRIDLAQLA